MKIDINLWLQDAIIIKLCDIVKKKKQKEYPEEHIVCFLNEAGSHYIIIDWHYSNYGESHGGSEYFEIDEAVRLFIN